ncbi:MAG: LCCL domain-containing protein [Steroidobacteraceae bacterium]
MGSGSKLCVLLAAQALAGTALAQSTLGLPGRQNASGVRERVGETITFVCPPTETNGDNVYGTDTYMDSSPVCPAAIHAGLLKAGQNGVVRILIGRGAQSFEGSRRNGVATLKYGSWGYSYTFVKEGKPGSIAWTTAWSGIPMDFTSALTLRCPAGGGREGALWGTNPYTADSSICLAAVHAGIIGSDTGGEIQVQRARGARQFPGSVKNGVTSRRWGAYEDAFKVEAVSPPASQTAGSPPAK